MVFFLVEKRSMSKTWGKSRRYLEAELHKLSWSFKNGMIVLGRVTNMD